MRLGIAPGEWSWLPWKREEPEEIPVPPANQAEQPPQEMPAWIPWVVIGGLGLFMVADTMLSRPRRR